MGGRTWSRKEEEYYWLELIPHSPKRLGKDLENKEQDWVWVAKEMKAYMGDEARRDYTHLCVFEHYFQNTYLGRFSPNAGTLPLKYYKHEQALKKQKEAAAAKKEQAGSDAESKPKAESPIEVDGSGDEETPIVINCQYQYPYPTTSAPYLHGHAPVIPRFTVPSSPSAQPHPNPNPNLAPPGSLRPPPPPQSYYYFPQFLANHGCLENRDMKDLEEDSLFVAQTQSPASWMHDGMAPPQRGYYYHHQ